MSTAQRSARPSVLPRAAALIVLAMALVLWADVLFPGRVADFIGASGYSPIAAVVISAVALPVMVGLWLRTGWAWWAGLIAATWQLLAHLLQLVVTTVSGGRVGGAAWMIAGLLTAFLVVLLLRVTRDACLRGSATANTAQ